MFSTFSKSGQSPFKVQKLRVMNRCGATPLEVGDVVALDLDASDAATQARLGPGGMAFSTLAEAMFANVVPVGADPQNALIVVVTDLLNGQGEDDTEVEVALSGIVDVKVGGTDWSSARSSCGVQLMADTTGANRRLVAASHAPNRGKVGRIVEAIDANLSSTNQTAKVLLFGFGSSVGVVGKA